LSRKLGAGPEFQPPLSAAFWPPIEVFPLYEPELPLLLLLLL
jgi:hypothetical protein